MPLSRLVLILVLAIAAAAITVWLGAFVLAAVHHPVAGFLVAVPLALFAYVLVRVISDRVRSAEDRRYDGVEK